MRRICYISGTRADFGLMRRTLEMAAKNPMLDISVCVTGMHLSAIFGNTIRDVEESGLRICSHIPVELDGTTGGKMARAIGTELIGIVNALEQEQPDVVMVLGDRGEMLAGAVAALHLNIPVVHIHGGERSGTVDEPVRHAISKLAHYHFVATSGSRERLVRMGEKPGSVFVTGAPGLDGIKESVSRSRKELFAESGFDDSRPLALVIFHPVVQEADECGEQMCAIMSAVKKQGLQSLCLTPNGDAGAQKIREALEEFSEDPSVRIVDHLSRDSYIGWMAAADVMIGNSSSGIIEAASLGLPVVNIGSRQNGRERSGNVIDIQPHENDIAGAINTALSMKQDKWENIYGNGRAADRIVELLATITLDKGILMKSNEY